MDKRKEAARAVFSLIRRQAEKTETAEEMMTLAAISGTFLNLIPEGHPDYEKVLLDAVIRFTEKAETKEDFEALRVLTAMIPI